MHRRRSRRVDDPAALATLPLHWMPAPSPGRRPGPCAQPAHPRRTSAELDGEDWWFRCRFAGPGEPGDADDPGVGGGWLLELEGLATLADVWLNGEHLARSESMFAPVRLHVGSVAARNELAIRFSALTPWLADKRPRPRWKTNGAVHQNLRWIRTTLLGRQPGWVVTPAPVGPWRPVRLVPWSSHRGARPACDDELRDRRGRDHRGHRLGGAHGDFRPIRRRPPVATLHVAGVAVPLRAELDAGRLRLSGSATVEGVERWWPHTHGAQPLYPVSVEVGADRLDARERGVPHRRGRHLGRWLHAVGER